MISEVGQNDGVSRKKEDKSKQTLYLQNRNIRRLLVMKNTTGADLSWTTDKALDELFERQGIEDPGWDSPEGRELAERLNGQKKGKREGGSAPEN